MPSMASKQSGVGGSRTSATRLWVGVMILFGLAYGALDEFYQSFVTGRSSSLFDLFIDSVGVVAGVMSIRELDRRAFMPI